MIFQRVICGLHIELADRILFTPFIRGRQIREKENNGLAESVWNKPVCATHDSPFFTLYLPIKLSCGSRTNRSCNQITMALNEMFKDFYLLKKLILQFKLKAS
jgi:hypothetical protein